MQFDIYKCFLPECNLDTALVEVILQKQFSVNHKKGNSTIAAKMKIAPLSEIFAVGLIDEDKRKLKELELFDRIDNLCKENLKLYRHPKRNHYFIQVCPAIEKWILHECSKGKIDLKDFDLPDTLEGLCKLKGVSQRNDLRFIGLFKKMLDTEACDEIRELRKWVVYLKEENYNANIEKLNG